MYGNDFHSFTSTIIIQSSEGPGPTESSHIVHSFPPDNIFTQHSQFIAEPGVVY